MRVDFYRRKLTYKHPSMSDKYKIRRPFELF